MTTEDTWSPRCSVPGSGSLGEGGCLDSEYFNSDIITTMAYI